MDDQNNAHRNDAIVKAFKLTGIGWVLAIDLVAPILLGWWLDGVFGLNFLVFIGLAVGFLLVAVSVWQFLKLLRKN